MFLVCCYHKLKIKTENNAAMFITFEGGEGCGKSTVITVVANRLQADGYNVLTTYDPGDTALSGKIRELVKSDFDTPMGNRAMLFLYCAARSQLVKEIIQPSLDAGHIVLSDRFSDSTIVYQGMIHELADQNFIRMVSFASYGLTPDRTFLLDVPVEVGMSRTSSRNERDRFDEMDIAFHERVRTCYLMLAERYKKRVSIVDATNSLDNVCNIVYDSIIKSLARRNRESKEV